MTDFNRNTSKFAGFAFALVVLMAGIGIALAAGGAAAQGGSGELVNDTIDVTNETESIYVDAVGNDSMNGSGPMNVTVTLEGLTADETAGNGTVLNETTLSVAAGATESVDVTLSDSDRETYDTVHVLVSTEDESLIDSVDWGSLVAAAGGAGGGLGGVGGSTGMVALVVLALAAIVAARGDDS